MKMDVLLKHQIVLIISIVIFYIATPVSCGFTDAIDTQNVDHVISSVRTPRIKDNTSLLVNSKKEERQSFYHMGNQFTSALANLAGFGGFGGSMPPMGGLRTVMMGGMLYGLSLIPAVVLALGGNGLPLGGMLSSLGLSKRALPDTSSAKMPLLSETQTRRLLQMLQLAFKQWNVADEHCKQLFVCQMYRQVSSNGVTPDLDLFKEALLHILERGGQRRAGRAAEHLLSEYEHYFIAARMGMAEENCEEHYDVCTLSLYPKNDGFKKTTSSKNSAIVKVPQKGDTGKLPIKKATA